MVNNMENNGISKSKNILIVEDSEALNHLIKKRLSKAGFNFHFVHSGKEAIEWASNNSDPILLIDYRLTDMKANEVIEKLYKKNINVYFAVMTGEGDARVAVEMLKLGARDYLFKDQHMLDLIPLVLNKIIKEVDDKNKLQKAEKALKISNEKYKSLIENANEGIVVTQDEVIKFANPKSARDIGYSYEELMNRPFIDLLHPDDKNEVLDRFKRKVNGEKIGEIKSLRVIRKDKKVIWIENNSVMINWNGRPAILTFWTNITKEKLTNNELIDNKKKFEELNDELEKRVENRTYALEEANKDLESFAYSVSHDLRVPLRHIKGFSDLLSKELLPNLSDRAKRYLTLIVRSIDDMNKLIDDLLLFSRTGRTKLNYTKIKFEDVVSDAKAFFEEDIKKKKVIFNIDKMPKIIGDPLLLKQVIINLISNALKYTRSRKQPKIMISCETENKNEFIITIQDNGIGFDNKYRDKIFGVFQRAHENDKNEGTGIGLAIVKRIINRHGGKVWAKSSINKGAAFFFSLPKKN